MSACRRLTRPRRRKRTNAGPHGGGRAQHVRSKLNKPWPDIPAIYGSASGAGWGVPNNYVEKVGDDGNKAPVDAGPYKFVSSRPGVEPVLETFEGYWRNPPSIKRIVMRSLPT